MGAGEGGVLHLNAPLVAVGAERPHEGVTGDGRIQHGHGGLSVLPSPQKQGQNMSHGGGDGGIKELLMLSLGKFALAVIVLTAMPHEDPRRSHGGVRGGLPLPLGESDGGGEVELLEASLPDDGVQRRGEEIHGGGQIMDEAVVAEPLAHVVIQLGVSLAVGHPHLGHGVTAISSLGGGGHREIDEFKEIEQDIGVVGIGVLTLPHVLPPVEIPGLRTGGELVVLGEIGEKGGLFGGFRGLFGVKVKSLLHEAVKVMVARLPIKDPHTVEQNPAWGVLRQGKVADLVLLVGRDVVGSLRGLTCSRPNGSPRNRQGTGGHGSCSPYRGIFRRGILPSGRIPAGRQLHLHRRGGHTARGRDRASGAGRQELLHVPEFVHLPLTGRIRRLGRLFIIPFGHKAPPFPPRCPHRARFSVIYYCTIHPVRCQSFFGNLQE